MKVVVVEYNPDWPQEFERESALIAKVLGAELLAIHHIGSTSVPGLAAKPIIDMLPVVRDIERVDTFNESMEALGFEPMGEFGLPGRRYFRKGGYDRTHQMHVFQAGNPAIERHLAFRDYLRAHPEIAARYAELKTGLALQHPEDIESYMDGKDAFIKEFEAKALEWQRGKL